MAGVKKVAPTWEALLFATPEQKVLRYLLGESTTHFTLRVLASKLKGVRGMGGAEGLKRILDDLYAMGLVEWLDHQRSVRLRDDLPLVQRLKILSAIGDIETLVMVLKPICAQIVLFGSRGNGQSHSESDYDVYVVTDSADEAKRIAAQHPLGKRIEVLAQSESQHARIHRDDPGLEAKLQQGIVLWNANWT